MDKLFIIILLYSVSLAVAGDIYRCTVNGRVTYASRPCGDNAERLRLDRPATGAVDAANQRIEQEERDAAEAMEMERRAQQEEIDDRLRDAEARAAAARANLEEFRATYYDPEKCAAARAAMLRIELSDPVAYISNPNWVMASSRADGFCGR